MPITDASWQENWVDLAIYLGAGAACSHLGLAAIGHWELATAIVPYVGLAAAGAGTGVVWHFRRVATAARVAAGTAAGLVVAALVQARFPAASPWITAGTLGLTLGILRTLADEAWHNRDDAGNHAGFVAVDRTVCFAAAAALTSLLLPSYSNQVLGQDIHWLATALAGFAGATIALGAHFLARRHWPARTGFEETLWMAGRVTAGAAVAMAIALLPLAQEPLWVGSVSAGVVVTALRQVLQMLGPQPDSPTPGADSGRHPDTNSGPGAPHQSQSGRHHRQMGIVADLG